MTKNQDMWFIYCHFIYITFHFINRSCDSQGHYTDGVWVSIYISVIINDNTICFAKSRPTVSIGKYFISISLIIFTSPSFYNYVFLHNIDRIFHHEVVSYSIIFCLNEITSYLAYTLMKIKLELTSKGEGCFVFVVLNSKSCLSR